MGPRKTGESFIKIRKLPRRLIFLVTNRGEILRETKDALLFSEILPTSKFSEEQHKSNWSQPAVAKAPAFRNDI